MSYKNKIIVLSSILGVVTILYVITFIFSVDNRSRRSSIWAPLDSKSAASAVSLNLSGKGTAALEKDNGVWQMRVENSLYPVRQTRVEDFLAALTKRAEYPKRSSNMESWEKFGVGNNSQKVQIKDGNAVVIELHFGGTDATGHDIFIRSGNTVRSGEDIFSHFFGERKEWYDLNLFPRHNDQGLTVDSIQRFVVTPPPSAGEGETPAPYTLVRNENGWKFEGGAEADKTLVESALRYMLDATAEDFVPPALVAEADIDTPTGSILFETGDASRLTISAGRRINEKLTVKVTGIEHIFMLSDYTAGRFWQAQDEFASAP